MFFARQYAQKGHKQEKFPVFSLLNRESRAENGSQRTGSSANESGISRFSNEMDQITRLRALRTGEVHRRSAERWLSRRMGRILSIAPEGGGLRRFLSGAEVRQRDGFGKQKYRKTSGSVPWRGEVSGWICEAEQCFLRLPTYRKIAAKALTVPLDHGGRLHQDDSVKTAWPHPMS
jgi:hypothetical protein